MHKIVIVSAVLVAAFFASGAQAANPQAAVPSSQSNCREWPAVQTGSGGSFSSRQECLRSRDAWAPSLSVVKFDTFFQIQGKGFHPYSLGVWSTGIPSWTTDDGMVGYAVRFEGCGLATLTYTDGFGVHATIQFQVC